MPVVQFNNSSIPGCAGQPPHHHDATSLKLKQPRALLGESTYETEQGPMYRVIVARLPEGEVILKACCYADVPFL